MGRKMMVEMKAAIEKDGRKRKAPKDDQRRKADTGEEGDNGKRWEVEKSGEQIGIARALEVSRGLGRVTGTVNDMMLRCAAAYIDDIFLV
ncbi:hypothetical protein COCNU_scaffold000040G000070 [Cocos nucifera]|nr:hypothetical protein [Cocos nucifera]